MMTGFFFGPIMTYFDQYMYRECMVILDIVCLFYKQCCNYFWFCFHVCEGGMRFYGEENMNISNGFFFAIHLLDGIERAFVVGVF